MSDLRERIMDILKKPQLAVLATITDEGAPWCRYIMIATGDDLTMRCATFTGSRKVAQIKANPAVHLTCGAGGADGMGPYLQISGTAECSVSTEERQGLWNEGLSGYFKGPDDPNFCVLIIKPEVIEYMGMGKMFPEVWHRHD
ncbi:pyridoxamine 5'-phosphate oxidase family protein [bacterium]|nr:pyridoxamine 5'-phosphate oxidase family protein [candidate division CSSED10-310 bacterium]